MGTGGCRRSEGLNPAADIVIGATLPLTGDAAAWGKNTQDGIELALQGVNGQGGVRGRKVRVQYEDTRALAKDAVSAYNKLVSIDKVAAIIDDSVSSCTLAMAPLATRDRVAILATGATAPSISGISPYVFRIWNSDAYEGEVAASHAVEIAGLKKLAILYINNDYGVGLRQVFAEQVQKKGGQIVATEAFDQSATDMRAQLTKIKGAAPDGIYLVGYPKEIPIALRQAKELGLNVAKIGTVAMQDEQLTKAAGDAAEGLVFPYPKEPLTEETKRFKEAFKTKYGKEPGITADVGFDAVNMIVAAMKASSGAGGDQIRDGLKSLKDFPGASGVMSFDTKGDVHKPMGMRLVKNGSFVWQE